MAQVPNPDEVCKLKVKGTDFKDFESVFVQLHFSESFNFFRFTAVERQPSPQQFNVQDECEVELGGEQAIKGFITVRQVAYDAETHKIQLQGKTDSWWPAKSSILPKRNFDGYDFEGMVTEVLKPFNVKATFKDVDKTKFQRLRCHPGENVWSFFDRAARERKAICGVDEKGQFRFVGKNDGTSQGTLEEGKNILKMQFVSTCENIHSIYATNSSSNGTDGHSGTAISKMNKTHKGSAKQYSPWLNPNEHPAYTQQEVDLRNETERLLMEGAVMSVNVTVQGWKSDNGGLWKPGSTVTIKAPMCPLEAEMTIWTATFMQDNSAGTLTTLELVPPFQANGQSPFNSTSSTAPQDPKSLDQ